MNFRIDAVLPAAAETIWLVFFDVRRVALLIPAGTGAQLTVATYTGSIDSDFPITLKPGEHGIGATKRFTFDIGKGDARISAESFSGDITIRSKGRRPQD